MRPVSNARSGEPGEVPDNEVNAHLGNSCTDFRPFSTPNAGLIRSIYRHVPFLTTIGARS